MLKKIAALMLLTFAPLTLRAGVNTLSPGDIILNNLNVNAIQQFSPGGTLLHNYTGTGSLFEGAGITPTGSLVTTYRTPTPGGVDIFNPSGTQTLTFTTPQVASNPADVSVFPDGVIAVNNQGSLPAVDEYSPTGAFIRSISLTIGSGASGNYVAPNGSLWVIQTNGRVQNFLEDGTPVSSFAPNYSGLVDLVVDPTDGTLYVTDYIFNEVHHYTPSGIELGHFTTNLSSLNGIGLGLDDTLYVVGSNNVIDHYTESGSLLGTIPINNSLTPLYLSVVPAPVPEPALITTLTAAYLALPRRRRRCTETTLQPRGRRPDWRKKNTPRAE